MNNMSSYCGLVDAKIWASDKDLPVQTDNQLIPDEADIKNIQSVLEVAIKEENDSDYEPFHGSFMVSRNTAMVFCYQNCSNLLWKILF